MHLFQKVLLILQEVEQEKRGEPANTLIQLHVENGRMEVCCEMYTVSQKTSTFLFFE